MKSSKLFERMTIVAVLTGLIAVANAEKPATNLPRIRAVPSNLGGEVACYGYDCYENVMNVMAPPLFVTAYDSISDEGQIIDHGEFCQRLKDRQPANCDAANPPSTPGADPNWQPNGCGTNKWIQTAITLDIQFTVPPEYSGNHNSPYDGVSFESACNTHDACWGRDFDRGGCDLAFNNAMVSACGVVTDPRGGAVCEGLAGFYFGAVSSTRIGDFIHAKVVGEHKCAMWAKDMTQNGCPQ